MVELSEVPVFVWLDSLRPPGSRMFGFLEVLRFRMAVLLEAPDTRIVGHLEGPSAFVWLDSWRPPWSSKRPPILV